MCRVHFLLGHQTKKLSFEGQTMKFESDIFLLLYISEANISQNIWKFTWYTSLSLVLSLQTNDPPPLENLFRQEQKMSKFKQT